MTLNYQLLVAIGLVVASVLGSFSQQYQAENGYWVGGEWYRGNFNPDIVIDVSHTSVSPLTLN